MRKRGLSCMERSYRALERSYQALQRAERITARTITHDWKERSAVALLESRVALYGVAPDVVQPQSTCR